MRDQYAYTLTFVPKLWFMGQTHDCRIFAAMSIAVFMHCHYFWGNIYNQAWFAVLGKIIAGCGFIAGLGIVIIRVGILGRG